MNTIGFFSFEVHSAQRFAPDKGAEVWLDIRQSPAQTVEPDRAHISRLVYPLAFRSLAMAEHAEQVLRKAFEDVAKIAATDPAVADDPMHVHDLKAERFSRSGPVLRICKTCNEVVDEISHDELYAIGALS